MLLLLLLLLLLFRLVKAVYLRAYVLWWRDPFGDFILFILFFFFVCCLLGRWGCWRGGGIFAGYRMVQHMRNCRHRNQTLTSTHTHTHACAFLYSHATHPRFFSPFLRLWIKGNTTKTISRWRRRRRRRRRRRTTTEDSVGDGEGGGGWGCWKGHTHTRHLMKQNVSYFSFFCIISQPHTHAPN